ncbi:unnamed protein product [Orchesella dallaii]|uniref:Cytochrome P450 n=1 Tax=Orchesella dallaii TaxID=48710 RepID=A0ABP1R2A3_9HEXA
MGLITLIVSLVILAITSVISYFVYISWKYRKFFEKQNVQYLGAGFPRLARFFTGKITLPDGEFLLYEDAKATGKPFVGITDLSAPIYFIMDLDLQRSIYVKDFDHFADRRQFTTEKSDILMRTMLISLEGEKWRGIRAKLSPTFTTGKIRKMFNIFDTSSHKMCDYIRKRVGSAGGDFDIVEAYSKYAMDVVANCAFGIDSMSFDTEPGALSTFEDMGNRITFKFDPIIFMKVIFAQIAPKLSDFLGVKPFDQESQKYFLKVIGDVMKQRRETGERRDDFLQLMLDAQKGLLKSEDKEILEVMTGSQSDSTGNSNNAFVSEANKKLKFEDIDIVSNAVLFLLAGFDTLQSLLIFAAYSLALHQDIQEKLLKEINSALEANGGKLTYDSVHGMNYLDMFINETLRYYPPATRTERRCTKDYIIPGTNTVIEKGTLVALPIIGIHRDERYYDNPEKFDPERFLPENKAQRHPYSFTPFGHGPRNCIGMRFALTEVKTVLANLVHNFKLEVGSYTEVPIKYGNSGNLKPKDENGMWLHITPRC